jgi:hypothetical protein
MSQRGRFWQRLASLTDEQFASIMMASILLVVKHAQQEVDDARNMHRIALGNLDDFGDRGGEDREGRHSRRG